MFSLAHRGFSLLVPLLFASITHAVDLYPITQADPPEPMAGKEVDWIYGDFCLRNDHIVAVVANPLATRSANMTTPNVGAGIVDLTLREFPNDQLTAFYPSGGRYRFHDPSQIEFGTLGEDGTQQPTGDSIREADAVYWTCRSATVDDGTVAVVTYRLRSGSSALEVEVRIEGDRAGEVAAFDGIRADRTFRFDATNPTADSARPLPPRAWCEDPHFRQTYGFRSDRGPLRWEGGRLRPLRYTPIEKRDGKTQTWNVEIFPATCPGDFRYAAGATPAPTWKPIKLSSPLGPVDRAKVQLQATNGKPIAVDLLTDEQGIAPARLPAGDYQINVTADGFPDYESTITVAAEPQQPLIELPAPAALTARITDASGGPIPCKLTLYGREGTPNPDFGPDSMAGAVKNCIYTHDGRVTRPINPGTYELIISRGPEYDAVFRDITLVAGETRIVKEALKRSVNTTGWVSTELHSHSSPSGDNTSDQRGRVLNLLAEHLEFAPCTEHNRIDSYTPHLEALSAAHLMATCTGMELTGGLLPVNHQNAFPLVHRPHYQDGGGPQTSTNPVEQIERLAMWDNGADKVVQANHLNIHQVYGDRDTNGVPDEGFREMLGFMDVMEVHPLEPILTPPTEPAPPRDFGNRITRWMKLLNQGHRIPGVVNTDAHYNHHGSGWLRNWFASSTDDPAEISVTEMIKSAEAGQIVMSTGPFMEVRLTGDDGEQAGPGQDLTLKQPKAKLHVRVQCPNWLDVNRVQLFFNGKMDPQHDYRRRTHHEMFSDAVVKFDQTIDLNLTTDAHVIVVAVGEGKKLGRVMGDQYGELPPIVVSNPIYVDRDGNGFTPNGDDLGVPLPQVPQNEPVFSPDQSSLPVVAPEGAVVLFDAQTNRFVDKHGEADAWPVKAGALISTPGDTRSNHLCSNTRFQDADIHVEFMLPESGAGNSGIYIHGNYEMQIYNSHGKPISKHSAGALYGFAAPRVNAARPPGQWQVYDIRYRAPRRNDTGQIVQDGSITAWLNGKLVQDGITFSEPRSRYHPYRYNTSDYLKQVEKQQLETGKGPLFLQDHGNPVRFRNVWIRPIDAT